MKNKVKTTIEATVGGKAIISNLLHHPCQTSVEYYTEEKHVEIQPLKHI
jgi:hypothetical protein